MWIVLAMPFLFSGLVLLVATWIAVARRGWDETSGSILVQVSIGFLAAGIVIAVAAETGGPTIVALATARPFVSGMTIGALLFGGLGAIIGWCVGYDAGWRRFADVMDGARKRITESAAAGIADDCGTVVPFERPLHREHRPLPTFPGSAA